MIKIVKITNELPNINLFSMDTPFDIYLSGKDDLELQPALDSVYHEIGVPTGNVNEQGAFLVQQEYDTLLMLAARLLYVLESRIHLVDDRVLYRTRENGEVVNRHMTIDTAKGMFSQYLAPKPEEDGSFTLLHILDMWRVSSVDKELTRVVERLDKALRSKGRAH